MIISLTYFFILLDYKLHEGKLSLFITVGSSVWGRAWNIVLNKYLMSKCQVDSHLLGDWPIIIYVILTVQQLLGVWPTRML